VEKQTRVPGEVFEKAIEKLWAHGGAQVDASENLTRGSEAWRDSYIAQGEQKQAQIEAMIRYAQSQECRMSSLVRHFGDTADSKKNCAICDFCAPEKCVAQRFRAATPGEIEVARAAIEALRHDGRSLGKLHTELCSKNGMDRDSFEELMGAMARAGLVKLVETVFEKDGRQIPFRKASLTRDAEYMEESTPLELSIRGPVIAPEKRKRGAKKAKAAPQKSRAEKPAWSGETKAVELLKEWRKAQAKKQGIPPFRILADKTLMAIAEEQPSNLAELMAISGIGLKTVEKYGAQIYKILEQARG
jgi:superfamily II DNA helicase RecQ